MSETERAWAAGFFDGEGSIFAPTLGGDRYMSEDVVTRLGTRKGLCHFCDHPHHFEVAVTLMARCAHSPVGVCKTHLTAGVKYAASCVDAGDYVLVGTIEEPAHERARANH